MRIGQDFDVGSSLNLVDTWGWNHLSANERRDSLLAALEWNNKKIKKLDYTRVLLDIRDQIISDLNAVEKEINKK